MSVRIKIQDFEGPLDLLLFLIKENEVSITDIPIVEITRQYLEALELMKQMDLELAGEYILMAATLIQIKARMLLPRENEDGETMEDPRQELVDRLLEYQQFKEVAGTLGRLEQSQRNHFLRRFHDFSTVDPEIRDFTLQDVDLLTIIKAFNSVMKRENLKHYHEVNRIEVSVEEQVRFVMARLAHSPVISLTELLEEHPDRIYLVVTFLALLDMMRNRDVVVRQRSNGSDIWIFRPDHFLEWKKLYYEEIS